MFYICHLKTLLLFPFLCQSTNNPRLKKELNDTSRKLNDTEKKLDDITRKLEVSQMSTSLMASTQPSYKYENCTFIHKVQIPADVAMRHPAIKGLGGGRHQPKKLTYYNNSDDSDSDVQ